MMWRGYFPQRWRLGLLLLLWPLLYLGGLAVSDRWLRGTYLDFTANHRYTLTPGTLQILDGLRHPIELKLYFSAHAASDLPQLRSYQQRVVEMLREFVSRSHGMLRLKEIDPLPYSDDEVSAESNGLTPLNGGSNGEQLFLGLVGQVVGVKLSKDDDHQQTLPLLDMSREGFLEYDLAKFLYELNAVSRPRIEFISGLPMAGNPRRGESPWVLLGQLRQLFDVTWVDQQAFHTVAKNVQAVFLIHPDALSEEAQYTLDQYVLGGGHLVIFVDPDAEMGDKPGISWPSSSDLPRLFHAWGVRYDPHEVVLDRSLALPIELSDQSRSTHPSMLGVGGVGINHRDMITTGLRQVNLASAGHFDLTGDATSRLIPLLQSSADAELTSAQRVLLAENDPSELLDGYHPDGVHYVLAARLYGMLYSAFPEYAKRPGYLARSKRLVEVVLVADTDLLSDRLWLRYTQSQLGQSELSVLADNGDFVTDLADALSSSSVLLSIHGRASSQRPFTRVQALQNAADQKSLLKQRELQHELNLTRHRLAELQVAKNGDEAGAHAEQKSEVEQFLRRQLEINKELREVKHSLNAEIDTLGQRLKWINIGLMPSLIALFGLAYGSWRRAGRRRSMHPTVAPNHPKRDVL